MSTQVSPLFHGTRRAFTRGGILIPRHDHGGAEANAPTNPGAVAPVESAGWVYVTERLDVVWAYAWAAPGRGKPKVLVVAPRGVVEPDPEHSPAMAAWRCEWAKITQVLVEPTVDEATATAGWSL